MPTPTEQLPTAWGQAGYVLPSGTAAEVELPPRAMSFAPDSVSALPKSAARTNAGGNVGENGAHVGEAETPVLTKFTEVVQPSAGWPAGPAW